MQPKKTTIAEGVPMVNNRHNQLDYLISLAVEMEKVKATIVETWRRYRRLRLRKAVRKNKTIVPWKKLNRVRALLGHL
jgi:hypothetical protein